MASGGFIPVVTTIAAKGKMEMSSDDSIGAYGAVTGWLMRRRA